MKTVCALSALVMLMSASAFASSVIPSSQLPQYEEAAELALNSFAVKGCTNATQGQAVITSDVMAAINGGISNASSGAVADSGEQPALTFFMNLAGDSERYAIEILTLADYKTVTEVRYNDQNLQDTNTGDLLNPTITQQWITTSTIDCQ